MRVETEANTRKNRQTCLTVPVIAYIVLCREIFVSLLILRLSFLLNIMRTFPAFHPPAAYAAEV